MPATTGWDVFHGMQGQGSFATWGEAVEAADLMAEARRDAANITTAVVVEMKGRDSAVVSVHACGRSGTGRYLPQGLVRSLDAAEAI